MVNQQTDPRDLEIVGLNGSKIKLGELLSTQDILEYETRRDGVVIPKYKITYEATKRLARFAGIFMVDEELLYSHIDSKDEHHISLKIRFDCLTKIKEGRCSHDGPIHFTKVGEASHLNTRSITKKYQTTTAEKRGFERGVIEHLGIPNLYGESEFESDDTDIGTKKDQKEKSKTSTGLNPNDELGIAKEISTILLSRSIEALEVVQDQIKKKRKVLNVRQLEYLRNLYAKKEKELTK